MVLWWLAGEFFAESEGAIRQLAQLSNHGKAFALAVEYHIDMSCRTPDDACSSGNGVTVAVKPVFCNGISLHVSHICDKINA